MVSASDVFGTVTAARGVIGDPQFLDGAFRKPKPGAIDNPTGRQRLRLCGTNARHIFVTFTGGGARHQWTNISTEPTARR